jgi:hypothetical protein
MCEQKQKQDDSNQLADKQKNKNKKYVVLKYYTCTVIGENERNKSNYCVAQPDKDYM